MTTKETAMPDLIFEPIAVPLKEDEHGAIRVSGTRLLLDLVVRRFQEGATPESIVESYDGLALADVYAVLSYYQSHTEEIDAYLRRRDVEAQEVRHRIEAAQPSRPGLRATVKARAQTVAREQAHAPAD
jgi:uncharacterized protein (DUF433 family)